MPHGNTVPVPLMSLQEASSTAGTRPGCGRYLEFRPSERGGGACLAKRRKPSSGVG
jgi:hypothetical protein